MAKPRATTTRAGALSPCGRDGTASILRSRSTAESARAPAAGERRTPADGAEPPARMNTALDALNTKTEDGLKDVLDAIEKLAPSTR